MSRLLLVILLAGVCACSSSSEQVDEADPFDDAEAVEDGVYADLPEQSVSTTWAPIRLLNDEWKQSVAGWSFTTRSVGRWAQRDWDRLFGPGD